MDLKQRAAHHAADWVQDGMVVGLGSGSTALHVVRRLGARLAESSLRDLKAVPTSRATEAEARRVGIALLGLDDFPTLDLTIDGADEVSPSLDLIKGLGGALLWEKIVAVNSRELVIVVDESKLVPELGARAPVPVEVAPFGWRTHLPWLEKFGARPRLRTDAQGAPSISDGGNYTLDLAFDVLPEPRDLAAALRERPGIFETGLFLGLVSRVVVARPTGIDVLTRSG